MSSTSSPPPYEPSNPIEAAEEVEEGGGATDPLLTSTGHRRVHSSIYNSNNNNNDHNMRRRYPGRILDRDADFCQSRGRWKGVQLLPRASGRRNRSSLSSINPSHVSQQQQQQLQRQRRHPPRQQCCHGCKRRLRQYFPRWWDDWFHTLAYQRTILLMLILFVVYSSIVVGFGFLYLAVSVLGSKRTYKADGSFVTESFCDMDINDHMEALYFSLSTMTTIGYGVSDYYFGGCWTPLLLVLMQVCTAITFDACAVGLLFTRLSRGRKRSKTVIVSDQSIVQRVQGIPYFMFRVAELRRFPLIEASVRVYCVRHERIPKLTIGDYYTGGIGGLGGMPSVATATANNNKQGNTNLPPPSVPTPTSTTTIPVETTPFVTRPMTLLHTNNANDSTTSSTDSNYILMSLPQVLVHRMDHHHSSPLIPPPQWYDAKGRLHRFPANPDNLLDTQAQIQDFWKDRRIEIIVLVEGIDELTGAAIQTRHSYSTYSIGFPRHNGGGDYQHQEEEEEEYHAAADNEDDGDVVWNRNFVNCVLPYEDDDDIVALEEEDFDDAELARRPICTVDFSKFHDTHPVPQDCLASPYVPF